MSRKLILIGIDGTNWKILGPRIAKGELQNFSKLVSRGTVGVLESTVPAESPPAWTSMFTGVNPGKHGIVDFLLWEGKKFVPCFSRYRMVQSIWRILSDAGRKCVVINEPVTYPPEPVNGLMTSGLMTPPGSTNWIYPMDRMEEINTIAGGYECDIPGDFRDTLTKDRDAALNILNGLMSKTFRVGTYAADNLEWDVLAVILTVTDRMQHFWWKDTERLSELYKKIDNMLGIFMECAKAKSADLMIVSDHGFGPSDNLVSINGRLEEWGLAVRSESRFSGILSNVGITRGRIRTLMGSWPTAFTILPAFMQDMIRRSVPESAEDRREIDVHKSVAFCKTPAGVFVQSNWRETVARRLSELSDPTSGERILEKVLIREETLNGPYSYRAPDLFLEPRLGFSLSRDKVDMEREQDGTHRPEGIFINYQPESAPKSGQLAGSIRPWDVAASILRITGLPVPDYFDGHAVDLD